MNSEIGIVVMVLELVLTGGLVLFQSFVVNKTGSIAVVAGSLHYRWNILVSIAVIVSLFVASYGRVTYSDPLFTVAIVLCMGVGSWPVAATALDDLMDCEFPDGDRIKIREIAIQHPRVRNFHDMRNRNHFPIPSYKFTWEWTRC